MWSVQVVWVINIPHVCCSTEAAQHILSTRLQKYTDLRNSEITILRKKHINIRKTCFHHRATFCSIVNTSFSDKNLTDKLKCNEITAWGRILESFIYQSRPLKVSKIVKTCPIFKIQKVFPFFTSGLAHQYYMNLMCLSEKRALTLYLR